MNLNKVILIGRLTQDPDVRSTPSGQSVSTIRMATNRMWTDQASNQKRESTEFHTVIAWGRLAEITGQYLKKGGLVMVEGRLQTRSWTGQDNVKRYVTEIVAENVQLGPRASSGQGSFTPQKSSDAPTTKASSEPEIPVINEDEPAHQGEEKEPIKEEDLPF